MNVHFEVNKNTHNILLCLHKSAQGKKKYNMDVKSGQLKFM